MPFVRKMIRHMGSRANGERGQVIVMTALMLFVFLGFGGLVIGVGNWFTHAKHLQTKADASALAGAGMWGLPCGPDTDTNIETQARTYVGSHTQADGAPFSSTLNPQVGGVDGDQVHVVLNGIDFYDDDPPLPAGAVDNTDPTGSICESMVLDVKVTEANSFPLFSLMPVFPDIKRKARVEIREIEGISGLLPIGVRFPKPASSAAVFYDEATGNILAVRYFQESTVPGMPSELRGYSTFNSDQGAASWARFSMPGSGRVGVAVATSVRPACDTDAPPGIPTDDAPCLEDTGFTTVDELCNQGLVRCFYASAPPGPQTVLSGLHFIRGYPGDPYNGTGAPVLRTAYLENVSCYANGYFNAELGTCQARVSLSLDLGNLNGEYTEPNPTPPPADVTVIEPLRAGDVEVRYMVARRDAGLGLSTVCNYGANCDLLPPSPSDSGVVSFSTQGGGSSPHISISAGWVEHAVAIQVRLRNAVNSSNTACQGTTYNNNCRYWYTANGEVPEAQADGAADVIAAPVQRSFMGDTGGHGVISGPIKFMKVTVDDDIGPLGCEGIPDMDDPIAASQPIGQERCYLVEMGLRGGIAQDQDEPPVAFNLSSTSQSALIDCDPDYPNLRTEIELGCRPFFRYNDFSLDPPCPDVSGVNQFFNSPPAPFDALWPPYTCVLTQTGSAPPGQIIMGIKARLGLGTTCPSETNGEFEFGRNYWHDANNPSGAAYTFAEMIPTPVHGSNLRDDDPRLINLFMTSYDSFGSAGNETYPIVAFGTFYITGFDGPGGNQHDPCTDGNSHPSPGAGSKPPPDLSMDSGSAYIWGHFINNVVPSPNASSSDRLCAPQTSPMPCLPVLVE